MAENDIYLVRQKDDGTFEELQSSPFSYSGLTGDVLDAGNEFIIKTKLRVPELKVEGTTTIIHDTTTTSEQLLITNDGTGPAVVINQLGTEAVLDVQDDGVSALYVRGDSPYAGFVGLGTTTPTKQLELTGDILLANNNAIYFNDATAGTPVAKKSLYQDSTEILTLANTGGKGVNIETGDSSPFLALRIDKAGLIGIGSGVTEPTAQLDIVRDGNSNIKFRHNSNSAVGEIDIDVGQTVGGVVGVMTIGTKTSHALTLGTNNVGFLKISQGGNVSLERKLVNGVMTTANLTIEGELSVPNATKFKIAGEELLWTDEFSVTGANHSESFKILEFSYRTHGWDNGSPFIVEIWSEYYSATGYQKYLVCHTHLDTDEVGTQGEVGAPDLSGGRDYQLKILESTANPQSENSAKFRLRMGTPEDTDLNDGDGYDIATVAVHAELKHYAKTRVKVTSLASNSTVQIGTDDDWTVAADEYRFYTEPTGVDITNDWDSYSFDPTGEDAFYADTFYGSRLVNDIGTSLRPTDWFLRPADLGTSMAVRGKVGIGISALTDPGAKLEISGDADAVIRLTNNQTAESIDKLLGALEFYSKDNDSVPEGVRASITCNTGNTEGSGSYLTFNTSNLGGILPRMTISKDGNVGIAGTTTSTKSNDDDKLTSSAFYAKSANPSIALLDTGGDTGVLLSAKNGGDFGLSTMKEGGADSVQNFTVTTQGKVGIGTDYPHSNLTVASTATAQLSLVSRDTSIAYDQEIGAILGEGYDSFTPAEPFTGAKIAFRAGAKTTTGLDVDWDTNTDYYWPTSIDFHTQAATATDDIAAGPRMTIASDGNVGIGTVSPEQKLHLADGVGVFQRDLDSDTGWTTNVALRNDSLVDNVSVGLDFQGRDTGGVLRTSGRISTKITSHTPINNQITSKMRFGLGSNQDLMVIEQDGNVGIGTGADAPVNKLQVRGLTPADGFNSSSLAMFALESEETQPTTGAGSERGRLNFGLLPYGGVNGSEEGAGYIQARTANLLLQPGGGSVIIGELGDTNYAATGYLSGAEKARLAVPKGTLDNQAGVSYNQNNTELGMIARFGDKYSFANKIRFDFTDQDPTDQIYYFHLVFRNLTGFKYKAEIAASRVSNANNTVRNINMGCASDESYIYWEDDMDFTGRSEGVIQSFGDIEIVSTEAYVTDETGPLWGMQALPAAGLSSGDAGGANFIVRYGVSFKKPLDLVTSSGATGVDSPDAWKEGALSINVEMFHVGQGYYSPQAPATDDNNFSFGSDQGTLNNPHFTHVA